MARLIPAILGLALLVSYGVAEGLATNRWRDAGDLDRAAARVADVPKTIGDWEARDEELGARETVVAGIRGGVLRKYARRGTGDVVTVLLICGRGGPMSVHTPDVCFAGNGYQTKGAPRRHAVETAGPAPAEFWAARFDKPGADHDALGIMWAWTVDGRWDAADNPRVRFGRSPAVYKLYLIHPVADPDAHPATDPVLADFARGFLPAARTALFPAPTE